MLCILSIGIRQQGLAEDAAALPLEGLFQPVDWVLRTAVNGLLEIAKFLVAGALAVVSVGRPPSFRDYRTLAVRWGLLLLLGIGLAGVLRAIEQGRVPDGVCLALPMIGYLLGAWIGSTYLRGYRAMLWMVPKLGCILLVPAAAGAGVAFLAMEEAPLGFEVSRVTPSEKRRLVRVLRSSQAAEGEVQRLRLAEPDVNRLLAIAFSQGPLSGKGRVSLSEGEVAGELSLKTPFRSPAFRYVNVRGRWGLRVTSGRLRLRPKRLRIGRLSIPRPVLRLTVPLLVAAVLEDPDLGRAIGSMDLIRLESGAVEVVYRSGEFNKKILPSLLARLGEKPNVLLETRIHLCHLVSAAGDLPSGERGFVAFLQTAFELARERSGEKGAVLENRAAILALAILLGHRRVESLVGPVSDPDLRRAAGRHMGRVTVGGRRDWPRHFLVSAALAILSNRALSNGAGLFKEEFDAGEGGSGFSFSDLLADRAGTQFGLAATRNQKSARRMQDRLADGFSIREVFPPAADLPEGIAETELESEYGGVKGERYQRMVEEIERRLATCAALQTD